MVRRFIWVVFDESIGSYVPPMFGMFSEADAMQAIADAGMSLCVHVNGLGYEVFVSSNGTYRRYLEGPLVPDSYGDSNLPIGRVLCQRSYYTRDRVVVNNSLNTDWLKANGRRAYIIEYTASKEYVINPESVGDDAPPFINLGWVISFYSEMGATVPDLSELKIWAVSRAGIHWQTEWPRGSGLYGTRPPVQFDGSGGTQLYEQGQLVQDPPISVRNGYSGEFVLGEIAAPFDIENDYSRGLGFHSRSWFPTDASSEAGKPPLFWEMVSKIDWVVVPAVALYECVPDGASVFTKIFFIAFINDYEIPEDSPFRQSPNWEPSIDPENYDEVRMMVLDVLDRTAFVTKPFYKIGNEYECPVLQLSANGLGLYDYRNKEKNTLVEVSLAELAAKGVDLSNTRPFVIANMSSNIGYEELFIRGTYNVHNLFLNPGGGAETFWKSFIKAVERL